VKKAPLPVCSDLQSGLDEIGVAMQVADIAHAAGKGSSISEFWLRKFGGE